MYISTTDVSDVVTLLFDPHTTAALQEACLALLQLPQLRTRIAVAMDRSADQLTARDFRTVTLELPPALQHHMLVCVVSVDKVRESPLLTGR